MDTNEAASKLLGAAGTPPFIYGTAWKKHRTKDLVKQAINAGFRAVDTAAQPRHYSEDLVGQAVREVIEEGVTTREKLYLQTKFTPPGGQDKNNMPYDPTAALDTQINVSISSSLMSFRPREDNLSADETYLDCLVLHSPLSTIRDTLAAWKVFESYVPSKVKKLGISNTDLETLECIYQESNIKPSIVQNRFHASTKHDVDTRTFCRANGIVYQSFWTLTGNPKLIASAPVGALSDLAGVSKEVALYALVSGLGIVPLNGTTNEKRMKSDMQDIGRVKNWTFVYRDKWRELLGEFKVLVGDEP